MNSQIDIYIISFIYRFSAANSYRWKALVTFSLSKINAQNKNVDEEIELLEKCCTLFKWIQAESIVLVKICWIQFGQ